MDDILSYTLTNILDFLCSGYFDHIFAVIAVAGIFNLVFMLTGHSSGRQKE